jgi:hypothetical protein
MGAPEISDNSSSMRALILRNLLTVVLSVAAALAAYYSTVSSLKVSLASKVESSELVPIEKRLNSVESAIDQNFINREDFFRFREDINYRLLKIEFKLENLIEGEMDGRKKRNVK